MLPPFALCLVLVGIHGYLGIHVLMRQVVFVDLALAQVAALGTAYAFLLGYDPGLPEDASIVYGFSLGFAALGAAVFALSRMRRETVPQEAWIGLAYATAAALSILILSKAPGEAEHLKTMLVGNVLLVGWPQIARTAGLYGLVGAFHFAFRDRFFAVSESATRAEEAGLNVRLWDFLFYLSFGIVITSSVAVAGVLLVFTYLVAPATFAMLFVESFRGRIAVAWIVGTFCSLFGTALSYYGDLPTGPAVVAVFALVLLLGAAVRAVAEAERPARAAAVAVASALSLALILRGTAALRKPASPHEHGDAFSRMIEALASSDEGAQLEAIHHLAASRDVHAVSALVALLRRGPSERVLEHAAEALAELGDPAAAPGLLEAGRRPLDPDLRLGLAEALFRLHDPRGLDLVLQALGEDPPLLARRRAAELLQRYFGQDFGYSPAAPEAERRRALEDLERWWAASREGLRWQGQKGRFE
jgi:zinc/manganese transport system permease protein